MGIITCLVLICRLMFDGRIRRRAGDKKYHSDDGYTSDPGIIREEDDDDETDENTETTDGADVSGILSMVSLARYMYLNTVQLLRTFPPPILSHCSVLFSPPN